VQRWTAAYRTAELTFILFTNNGTRSLSEDFRHEFMNDHADTCLSELMTVIVRQQLPALLATYVIIFVGDNLHALVQL